MGDASWLLGQRHAWLTGGGSRVPCHISCLIGVATDWYVIMTCKGLMTKREWNGHYRLPTYWFYALDVMVNPT